MPDQRAGAPPPVPTPLLALAFDYGERRIGVACGGTLSGGGRPLGTAAVSGGGPDWSALGRLVKEWAPQVLVVGVPYNMDGTAGRLTAASLEFAAELGRRFQLAVVTVDERLSSREAEDILRQQRASGERTRRVTRGAVDATAACVILEQWLRGRSPDTRNE